MLQPSAGLDVDVVSVDGGGSALRAVVVVASAAVVDGGGGALCAAAAAVAVLVVAVVGTLNAAAAAAAAAVAPSGAAFGAGVPVAQAPQKTAVRTCQHVHARGTHHEGGGQCEAMKVRIEVLLMAHPSVNPDNEESDHAGFPRCPQSQAPRWLGCCCWSRRRDPYVSKPRVWHHSRCRCSHHPGRCCRGQTQQQQQHHHHYWHHQHQQQQQQQHQQQQQ